MIMSILYEIPLGGQSFSNYTGTKTENPQACLTSPVYAAFSLKVAWSGMSLIGRYLGGPTQLLWHHGELPGDKDL